MERLATWRSREQATWAMLTWKLAFWMFLFLIYVAIPRRRNDERLSWESDLGQESRRYLLKFPGQCMGCSLLKGRDVSRNSGCNRNNSDFCYLLQDVLFEACRIAKSTVDASSLNWFAVHFWFAAKSFTASIFAQTGAQRVTKIFLDSYNGIEPRPMVSVCSLRFIFTIDFGPKVGTRRTGILETEAWNFQSLAFGWPVAADGTNRGEHDHVQLRIDMCTFGFFKSLRSTHLHNHRMKRSCVGCSSPKPWVCTAFRGMMTSWLSPRFFLCADARRPSNSDAPLNLKCACLLSLEGQDRKCNHPQTAISQQAQ